VTQTVVIALAVFIVVLTVLSIYGVIPALRIVPDNTTFHFMDFRRISFPPRRCSPSSRSRCISRTG